VLVQSVSSYVEFDADSRDGFVTRTGAGRPGDYVYHVIGGQAPSLGCGPTDPHPVNNLYLKSRAPLSVSELKPLLKPDGEEITKKPLPPGIEDLGNGCPTPGIGGQPGKPESRARPGISAVETPLSSIPELLVTSSPSK
jgi:hypothetical protein